MCRGTIWESLSRVKQLIACGMTRSRRNELVFFKRIFFSSFRYCSGVFSPKYSGNLVAAGGDGHNMGRGRDRMQKRILMVRVGWFRMSELILNFFKGAEI